MTHHPRTARFVCCIMCFLYFDFTVCGVVFSVFIIRNVFSIQPLFVFENLVEFAPYQI